MSEQTKSLRSLLSNSDVRTRFPEPVAAAEKELAQLTRPIVLPAKAYIHTLDELSRLVGEIYQVPHCTKHGGKGMKICGACKTVACSGCDPLFCRCQAIKAGI